jgi:Protein of unknown function (DUF1194)
MAVRASWGVVALLELASPALAENCRLALVLALDVSSSVDAREDRLQREGLARALVAPQVVRAFLAGEPVALYVFEWSGPTHQVTFPLGWHLVDSEEDLVRIAVSFAGHPASDADLFSQTTAVGSALAYAATALKAGPNCWARTVDISGDGENNHGAEPAIVYGGQLFDGVTVNALVIGGSQHNGGLPGEDDDLTVWFEANVLHGPGAFWVLANGYEDYERAMKLKLLRELELPLVSGWPPGRVAG